MSRKVDMGAFFSSIHGTLNHVLLTDRLWLGRFLERPFAFESLDQELYAEFDELRAERAVSDDEIDAWVATLTSEQAASPFTFHSVSRGRDLTFPLGALIVHFFNHQTHHRGQLTALIHQAGFEPGVTDLPLIPGMLISAEPS